MGSEQTHEFERRPPGPRRVDLKYLLSRSEIENLPHRPIVERGRLGGRFEGNAERARMASKRSGGERRNRGRRRHEGETLRRAVDVDDADPAFLADRAGFRGDTPEWSQATQLPRVGCPAKDSS